VYESGLAKYTPSSGKGGSIVQIRSGSADKVTEFGEE